MHEHAGRQHQIGVGQHRAHPKGPRHLVDPGVDRGDPAAEGAPGKSRARGAHRLALAHPTEEDLGHAELDLDLGQIVERGQHGVVVDAGADVDAADADHAGERRLHRAVGELLAGAVEPRLGPEKGRLELVHGRLRDGVVGAQPRRAIERQLGLAQRRLGLGDGRLLGLVVDAHQDGARLDPLAGREGDRGDPTRGQGDDVDRLPGERRADRFDPLADGSGLGRGERHRHRVRPAPDRRRGLAVGLQPMVDEAAGAERHRDDHGDRELSG